MRLLSLFFLVLLLSLSTSLAIVAIMTAVQRVLPSVRSPYPLRSRLKRREPKSKRDGVSTKTSRDRHKLVTLLLLLFLVICIVTECRQTDKNSDGCESREQDAATICVGGTFDGVSLGATYLLPSKGESFTMSAPTVEEDPSEYDEEMLQARGYSKIVVEVNFDNEAALGATHIWPSKGKFFNRRHEHDLISSVSSDYDRISCK